MWVHARAAFGAGLAEHSLKDVGSEAVGGDLGVCGARSGLRLCWTGVYSALQMGEELGKDEGPGELGVCSILLTWH